MHIGANALDITVDRTAITLLAILMFGAGTDYCLLLVARYSSELRAHDDKHTAIGNAVRRAGPAIAASGMVVAGALVTLLVADLQLNRVLRSRQRGRHRDRADRLADPAAGAARRGGETRLLAVVRTRGPQADAAAAGRPPDPSLAPLPQALIVASRNNPDSHPAVREREGIWRRSAWRRSAAVADARRAGLFGRLRARHLTYTEDVNVVGQFRTDTESTEGFELLRRASRRARSTRTRCWSIDPGAVSDDASRAADGGRARRRRGGAGAADRQGRGRQLRDVRRHLRRQPVPGTGAEAGRGPPQARGRARAAEHRGAGRRRHRAARRLPRRGEVRHEEGRAARAARDHRRCCASCCARSSRRCTCSWRRSSRSSRRSASRWSCSTRSSTSRRVDPALPLLAFVFLVALGVDYNIFLMDRVREESREHGTKEGVLRGLWPPAP